jgi:hypothetical protein
MADTLGISTHSRGSTVTDPNYSGIQPPAAPQPAAPLLPAPPAPERVRIPVGAFVAAGAIAGAMVLVVGVFVLSAGIARVVDARDIAAAESAVRAFDAAYAAEDCSAFEAVTTEDARDDILGTDYDCDAFEAAAAAVHEGGDYVYSTEVTGSRKRGGAITVRTEEAFGDSASDTFAYVLENEGGRWLIAAYGSN